MHHLYVNQIIGAYPAGNDFKVYAAPYFLMGLELFLCFKCFVITRIRYVCSLAWLGYIYFAIIDYLPRYRFSRISLNSGRPAYRLLGKGPSKTDGIREGAYVGQRSGNQRIT